jgi:hypothetical protein
MSPSSSNLIVALRECFLLCPAYSCAHSKGLRGDIYSICTMISTQRDNKEREVMSVIVKNKIKQNIK